MLLSDLMPWISSDSRILAEKAKTIIQREFSVPLECEIFLTNSSELEIAIIDELRELKYSKKAIEKIKKHYLERIVGKYFKNRHEIWVLVDTGENIDTLVHEFLHSIQVCDENREGIVDFITFRLTGNKKYIDTYDLANWLEIEGTNGFRVIKKRLLTKGDCEEF